MKVINGKDYHPNEEDIRQLREWIKKIPHLIQDYDDTFLAAFFRGCKGSLQKTKNVLENFNAIGMSYPALFKSLDPLNKRTRAYLKYTRIFPLPKKAPDGSIVIMASINAEYNDNLTEFYSLEFYRHLLMWLYVFIWENDYGQGKWTVVYDFDKLTLTHIRDTTPMAIKQLVKILQTAVPVRLQAAHIINVPPFMGWIINLIKSLVHKKIASRMHFHSSMEKFYNDVPKEYLPKEYGGHEESATILHERWKIRVEGYRAIFLEEQNKMRKLDPMRPKKTKEDFEIERMVGSFKALNID